MTAQAQCAADAWMGIAMREWASREGRARPHSERWAWAGEWCVSLAAAAAL
jgi:hypothetical protein